MVTPHLPGDHVPIGSEHERFVGVPQPGEPRRLTPEVHERGHCVPQGMEPPPPDLGLG